MKILNEDTFGNLVDAAMAADDAGAEAITFDPDGVTPEGDIEVALNDALKDALRNKKRVDKGMTPKVWPTVLFIGEAGSGKTARTEAWCKAKGINLFKAQTNTFDETDLGGVPVPDAESKRALKYSFGSFEPLNRPNSVLFLDEYNGGRPEVRRSFLTLMANHKIPGTNEKGETFFDNLLFTIIAINPGDDDGSDDYNVFPLDKAEWDRVRRVEVETTKENTLDYYRKAFGKDIEMYEEEEDEEGVLEATGRLAIAEKLLTYPEFRFSTVVDDQKATNKKSLSSRSLELLLENCDGTKEDFLSRWNSYCNNTMKPIAEEALADFEDVTYDNVANSVFNTKESTNFTNVQSDFF